MPQVDDADYLTTSQVAAAFQVDPSAVRRWIMNGKVKPAITTPGGHHRFRRTDIEKMLGGAEAAS